MTVPKESPLGRLTGTDNLVEFTTRWYNPNPLVIQGRGAGVDATAAGVLSDMIELAFYGLMQRTRVGRVTIVDAGGNDFKTDCYGDITMGQGE